MARINKNKVKSPIEYKGTFFVLSEVTAMVLSKDKFKAKCKQPHNIYHSIEIGLN
jgi:hypothetical protein